MLRLAILYIYSSGRKGVRITNHHKIDLAAINSPSVSCHEARAEIMISSFHYPLYAPLTFYQHLSWRGDTNLHLRIAEL